MMEWMLDYGGLATVYTSMHVTSARGGYLHPDTIFHVTFHKITSAVLLLPKRKCQYNIQHFHKEYFVGATVH